jgi:hypothetical protein
MASTTLARAATFSFGATESSRSRKEKSAVAVGALARKRLDEPGVERQERRGRERERRDMRRAYCRRTICPMTLRDYTDFTANFSYVIRSYRSS